MNITGESSDMVNIINIREYLPENVKLADSGFNGRVTATVYIEPEAEKTFTLGTENFTIINVPEGYQAEIAEPEETYTLRITGLNAAVSAVQRESVQGIADVAAWLAEEELEEPEAKNYYIPVKVSLPDDVMTEDEILLKVSFIKSEE